MGEASEIEPPLDRLAIVRPTQVKLLYDKAADCDSLRDRLAERGVDLVCPHRKNRKRHRNQDHRKLRAYKHRFKIERSNSWLQSYRKAATRYERYAAHFFGWIVLACVSITMGKF